MSPTRHRVLIRTLSILRGLEAGRRVTVTGLAAEYHVSPRTIWRDFEAFQDAGYPICAYPDSGEGAPKEFWLQRKR